MRLRYLLVGMGLAALLVMSVRFIRQVRTGNRPLKISAEEKRSKGPAEAPVRIVEFSSFQCPACRTARETLTDLMKKYPGRIKVVFKHYPLSRNRWADIAHRAAECAAQANAFWRYHDRLFEEMDRWSHSPNPEELMLSYAREMRLNLDAFAGCLAAAGTEREILRDLKEGGRLQIRATPTFFINDKRLVGPGELAFRGEEIIREILGAHGPEKGGAS